MTLPELANLQIDLEARVLHLRIDRPERRNALDLATRAALTDGRRLGGGLRRGRRGRDLR